MSINYLNKTVYTIEGGDEYTMPGQKRSAIFCPLVSGVCLKDCAKKYRLKKVFSGQGKT